MVKVSDVFRSGLLRRKFSLKNFEKGKSKKYNLFLAVVFFLSLSPSLSLSLSLKTLIISFTFSPLLFTASLTLVCSYKQTHKLNLYYTHQLSRCLSLSQMHSSFSQTLSLCNASSLTVHSSHTLSLDYTWAHTYFLPQSLIHSLSVFLSHIPTHTHTSKLWFPSSQSLGFTHILSLSLSLFKLE